MRYGRINGFIKVHRRGSLGPQLVGGKQVHLTFRDHILKPSLQRKSTYLSGRVLVTLVFNLLLSSEECCIFHRKSTASIFPLNIYIFSWISNTYVNPSKVPWKLASRSQEWTCGVRLKEITQAHSLAAMGISCLLLFFSDKICRPFTRIFRNLTQ